MKKLNVLFFILLSLLPFCSNAVLLKSGPIFWFRGSTIDKSELAHQDKTYLYSADPKFTMGLIPFSFIVQPHGDKYWTKVYFYILDTGVTNFYLKKSTAFIRHPQKDRDLCLFTLNIGKDLDSFFTVKTLAGSPIHCQLKKVEKDNAFTLLLNNNKTGNTMPSSIHLMAKKPIFVHAKLINKSKPYTSVSYV
ncbi:unnamed protein product, partial [marine sediment metagenome]